MKKIYVLSLLFVFLALTAFAGTINLPRTGQTKCYNTSGGEIPCAGTGQDGEIQAGVGWPDPRFADNDDGTMTDYLTGLIWASNANIMPTRDPDWDTDFARNDGMVTWQHALAYVAKLNAEDYLGYSDWRMPNVNELESLVNANESLSGTWLNTQGFTNVQGNWYWSSTTKAYPSDLAWCVGIWNSGWVDCTLKSESGYVWPVRSGQCGSFDNSVICLPKTGQTTSYYSGDDGDLEKGVAWPSPRFTDNGTGTVTDYLTGLMWAKDTNLPYDYSTWQQALDYIAGMNAGTYPNFGFTDWHLPNKKEFFSLIDHSQWNPALPIGNPFIDQQNSYWSSTSVAESPGYVWEFLMGSGVLGGGVNSYDHCYVWPVRAGLIIPTYSISGTITGDVKIDVTMTLTGSGSGTTTTDSSGNYSFTGLSNGTYTITPSKSGYTFYPTSRTVTIEGASQIGMNFMATKIFAYSYSISGSVTGDVKESVTIFLSGNSSDSTTTDVSGNYTFTGLSNGQYTIAPNKSDYTFTPTNRNITIFGANVSGADFVASSIGCTSWDDVIVKYNIYVSRQATWTDVITCYSQYASQGV